MLGGRFYPRIREELSGETPAQVHGALRAGDTVQRLCDVAMRQRKPAQTAILKLPVFSYLTGVRLCD